jgi:hypothetical protein
MTVMRLLAALVLMGAVDSAVAQKPSEWRVEKDENGIRIESRAVPGWDIREMRGTARFGGPLASLVAVINDPAAAPRLNELVAESKVVQRESETRFQVYTLTKMPWPLKDRDVLTQRVIEHDAQTGVVTIADEATAGAVPEQNGLVRITRSHNRWTLTPTTDGAINIELRMLSDPAGPIPSSLINSMSVSTPLKTIAQLMTLAREPVYAEANAVFVVDASSSGTD